MINSTLLRTINPRLSEARAAEIARGLSAAAAGAGINTPARITAFLAQLAHESCGFRYAEELWGPTSAQRRYEGRADLGNTQPGDGYRYRGRGWIQLTGRHNYRKFGQLLGLDLEGNPDLAARPDVAARLAAAYWTSRGLNSLSDQGKFREITRRINGGYNGYADRLRYHTLIHEALKAVPQPGRVLLVPMGGSDPVPWDGRSRYNSQGLTALVPQLRQAYPVPGGPWEYGGVLRVWVRQNDDLVLERLPVDPTNDIPATPPKK
ncbi:glycoside hydrolase family 19 protein [Deinococcus radiophilus]|uniref:glycoside hydrolase family 19 protein n=1 Tax=Deinococcus radiophilus TaxID=32062 RepID=UPI001E471295|nr:glycoside hydrolase family 19 protein [Deinococcus radiophilus]UFA50955.1 glycoside hydrolase, family 19 [Deinococcus radiophilus]